MVRESLIEFSSAESMDLATNIQLSIDIYHIGKVFI